MCLDLNKSKNKEKLNDYCVVTVATSFTILDYRGVDTRKNIYGRKMGLVLLDSGSSGSLIAKKYAKYGKSVKSTETNYTEWETPAGDFRTKEKKIIKFKLDEFSSSKQISWNFNVVPTTTHDIGYDMIIGRDLMVELGIIIDFEKKTMTWAEATMGMHTCKSDIKL